MNLNLKKGGKDNLLNDLIKLVMICLQNGYVGKRKCNWYKHGQMI